MGWGEPRNTISPFIAVFIWQVFIKHLCVSTLAAGSCENYTFIICWLLCLTDEETEYELASSSSQLNLVWHFKSHVLNILQFFCYKWDDNRHWELYGTDPPSSQELRSTRIYTFLKLFCNFWQILPKRHIYYWIYSSWTTVHKQYKVNCKEIFYFNGGWFLHLNPVIFRWRWVYWNMALIEWLNIKRVR